MSFGTDGDAVVVRDGIEDRTLRLETADRSRLRPAVTDMFVFPVDRAVSFEATELRLGAHRGVRLRDADGDDRGGFDTRPREVSGGTRFLAVDGPVKLYVRVPDANFTAAYADDERQSAPLVVEFDDPTEVAVGARSTHTRPEATITVPESPEAMLEAVSYLGSSIKEFSAERSWPSLRGHPPAIEVGDELDVPATLSKPDTGVTIAVPPSYANAYRVAPLAFYLGATVEPGASPELRLDNGYVEPLRTDDRSLTATVADLLGRCLVLDSLVRVGGYFSLPRHEYDELAPYLHFYPPNLYDASIPDQLIEYLEVPRSRLDPYVPEWPARAVLRPRPADAALLPSLLDGLAPVRVSESATGWPDRDSPTTAYVHDDPPAGTCRLVPATFEHARSRAPPTPADASIAVLTADAGRAARFRALVRDETLGDRSVTVRHWGDDRAAAALAAGHDLLYCDRSVPADGRAGAAAQSDLQVDARTVVFAGEGALSAAVDAVERGGVGGIAAERPLSPRRIRTLVEVLLAGHPLAESARLADLGAETPFRLVGLPSRTAVRIAGENVPVRFDVESTAADEHEVAVRHQGTDEQPLGTCARFDRPTADDAYQLVGTALPRRASATAAEVHDLLTDPDAVVRFNGTTYHDERDVSTAFVRDEARRHLRASR